jgi:hypothetical protein
MARYRFLQDCVDRNGIYYQAGTIASTADVGGTLPTNFIPPPAVEPLDQAAANAFFAAGVKLFSLIRPQWTGIPVTPPTCKWIPNPNPTGGPTNPYREWILAGPLGAGLGFAQIGGVGVGTGQAP